MPTREIVRVSFWTIAKSRAEGANRVTELRDRIKTTSVCPSDGARLNRSIGGRLYSNSRCINLNCEKRSFAFCSSLFLLFYSWSSLVYLSIIFSFFIVGKIRRYGLDEPFHFTFYLSRTVRNILWLLEERKKVTLIHERHDARIYRKKMSR